jgi:hypothetical protein
MAMFKPMCFALLALTMMFAVRTSHSAKDATLVLYLTFDEGAGKQVKDLSGNNLKGENQGAKWVDGKYGKALQFSGPQSWVTVENNALLNFGAKDSLTAEAWAKIEGPPNGQGNIVAKYAVGAGTTPFYGIFHNANNKARFYIRDAAGTAAIEFSKTDIADQKWHHFALVRDREKAAKKVRFYVDGTLEVDMDDPSEDLTNNVPLAIGRHTGEHLVGVVDEVAIWRRPLSLDEIKVSMEGNILGNLLAVEAAGKLATTWANLKKP